MLYGCRSGRLTMIFSVVGVSIVVALARHEAVGM